MSRTCFIFVPRHIILLKIDNWCFYFSFTEDSAEEIKADLATKTHLSLHPSTRDPYEATLVDVHKSTITKAGDGVFLTQDVAANTTVSFFNGIRISKNDVFSWNPFKKSSVYLVETTDEQGNDMFLDIPQNYVSWNKYKASAGHKVNHSKNPNVAYTECEHPIFGKILCLYTLKVKKKSKIQSRCQKSRFFFDYRILLKELSYSLNMKLPWIRKAWKRCSKPL